LTDPSKISRQRYLPLKEDLDSKCGLWPNFLPPKKAPLWPKSLFSLIVIDTGKMNDYF
jgi:hypothetical protein